MSHTIPQPSQLAFWVLNSQNWEKSGQKWPKNRHLGVYFGGLTLPGPTMRIQMGVNWSQATGILSHTIPQLSQLALWVLNSKNRKKSGQKWPKNRHLGVYFGGFAAPRTPKSVPSWSKVAPGPGTLSHTKLHPSLVALLALKSPNWVKCGPKMFQKYPSQPKWPQIWSRRDPKCTKFKLHRLPNGP